MPDLNIKQFLFCCKMLMLLLLFLAFQAKASETIQSGRPGQAIGAGTLDPGYIQIQSGLDYINSSGIEFEDYLFSNVIRLGVNGIFELSALINYIERNFKERNFSDTNGLSSLHLGFRSRVIRKQKGYVPQLVIQTRFKLKAVDSDFRGDNIAPVFTASAFNKINNKYALTTNLGFNTDASSGKLSDFWVLNFSRSMTSKINAFVELYGSFESDNRVLFDTGFDYLLNPDTKLDFSAGYGKNSGAEEYFVSLGVSYRAQIFN